MLNITMHGNILQVEQVIMSFTETKSEVFSYDFSTGLLWEGVHNAEVKKASRLMCESQVLWAAKHWMPKVNAEIYQRKYRLVGEAGKRRAYVLICGVWQRIGLSDFEQIQLNGLVFESHNTGKYKHFTEYLLYVKKQA